MSEHNDWEDVNDFIPQWNPKFKGSSKEGNKVMLKPTDKSYIIGYYIGSREQQIGKYNYTIHKVKVMECGNHDHLAEELPPEGKIFEFFGQTVVNSQIKENVTPGEYVKIIWLGEQEPKKEGGQTYDGWRTLRNPNVEPLNIKNGVIIEDGDSSSNDIDNAPDPDVASSEAEKKETAKSPDQSESDDDFEDDDDDLPF